MKRAVREPGRRFDWHQARDRLASLAAATDPARRLPPEKARAVLEERACLLSQPLAPATPASEQVEVITFSLARERYALPTRVVREVLPRVDLVRVPGAGDLLAGVLNLRGEILAVFDLRRFLALEETAPTELSTVLVLGGERVEMGLLATAVHEVRTLRADNILPPPVLAGGLAREHLAGVTPDALIVLAGDVLLRDRRLFLDLDNEMTSNPGTHEAHRQH